MRPDRSLLASLDQLDQWGHGNNNSKFSSQERLIRETSLDSQAEGQDCDMNPSKNF